MGAYQLDHYARGSQPPNEKRYKNSYSSHRGDQQGLEPQEQQDQRRGSPSSRKYSEEFNQIRTYRIHD